MIKKYAGEISAELEMILTTITIKATNGKQLPVELKWAHDARYVPPMETASNCLYCAAPVSDYLSRLRKDVKVGTYYETSLAYRDVSGYLRGIEGIGNGNHRG